MMCRWLFTFYRRESHANACPIRHHLCPQQAAVMAKRRANGSTSRGIDRTPAPTEAASSSARRRSSAMAAVLFRSSPLPRSNEDSSWMRKATRTAATTTRATHRSGSERLVEAMDAVDCTQGPATQKRQCVLERCPEAPLLAVRPEWCEGSALIGL